MRIMLPPTFHLIGRHTQTRHVLHHQVRDVRGERGRILRWRIGKVQPSIAHHLSVAGPGAFRSARTQLWVASFVDG